LSVLRSTPWSMEDVMVSDCGIGLSIGGNFTNSGRVVVSFIQ
jgi:hypothetical protein